MSSWWRGGGRKAEGHFRPPGLNFSTETRPPTYPGKQSTSHPEVAWRQLGWGRMGQKQINKGRGK